MKSSSKTETALLFLFEELFVIAAAISLALTAVDVDRMTLPGAGILRQEPVFERSDLFRNRVQERLDSIVRDCRLKSNFEQDGRFYGRKIVDLAEYVEKGLISGQQKNSVGYYLEDLIRWSGKGLELQYVDPEKSGAVSMWAIRPITGSCSRPGVAGRKP